MLLLESKGIFSLRWLSNTKTTQEILQNVPGNTAKVVQLILIAVVPVRHEYLIIHRGVVGAR
ncbi:hypothetical protein PQG02_09255 [Nostoc sp. UHCC 0926]|uniref:hypothetical protein n=1 Tax=Nostoc sp. TaxID=1180 RepID=UPI0027A612B6|nr:hypothetical protein PQG02_09255 [Nostoc sp. UHCC 0926]